MNINRNNYEEYFLLYVDNELSPEERKAVEQFIAENTDLKQELQLLQDTVLKPERSISFDWKSSLMRPEVHGVVNESNCEEYFLLYTDNELDETKKSAVEKFVEAHPSYKQTFQLIQLAKLEPDTDIVFPDKSSLYRKQTDDKVVPFTWWKMLAAAVILLMAGLSVWFLFINEPKNPDPIAKQETPERKSVDDKKPGKGSSTNTSESKKPEEQVPEHTLIQDQQLAAHQQGQEKAKRKDREVPVRDIKPVYQDARKKIDVAGNISDPINVTPKEDVIVKREPKNTETVITDPKPDPNETVAVTTLVSGTAEQYEIPVSTEESDNDIIYVANTSVSKKNKLRGLVRQASRLFEKATSLEPVRNRGIRIASFEVGMK